MLKEEKDLSSLQLYKRLLSYVLPYIPQFIVSILGFAIYSGSQVAATEWLKRVIDYVNDPVGDFRIILPILLIIIALIRGVGFFIGNYLLASISNRLVHNLRTELFTKLTVLPSSFFDSQTSGHLISRITFNVMQVTGAATNALKIFIREGLLVIGLITYLMFLNWKLALFLFIAAPFIAVIVGFAAKRLRSISGKIQTAMGDVTHVASEAINGYREVKSFGGEKYEIDRFKNASDNNRKQNLRLEATNSIASPLVQIFVSAALALITWLALDTSIVNDMSPGTFIAFFSAAGMLAKPVRQLSEINSQIQKGLAAASDIFIQLDEEPEKNNGTYTSDEIKGRISFKDVSFSYSQDADRSLVLSKINLEIQEGETVAFVGKSGAGKTSLLSLIPRFYEQSEGEILIDDVSINDYEIKNLRSHISLVSQDVTLFNDTIFNNISYGMKDADLTNVQEAAKKANAHDFIQAMPDGYNTLAGDDGVLLSGGQRQRIAIARAILKNSPFLILDEATSALDSESENVIQDALQFLTKDRTTLVIAHRLSTIENADKIVVLNDGVIAEVGTHLDLLKNKGIYTELHNNQFKDQTPEILTQNVLEIKKDFPAVETNQSGFLENSWNQKSTWLFILWPLSLITKYISIRRRKNYLTGKSKSWKSDIPIIVVGNIVVGGTGKTPVVIWLAKALKKMGFKPGIVSRGYGGKAKNYPLSVDKHTSVKDCGDEPKIIAFNTGCPVYVSPNRVQAAKQLSEKENIDFIISDDGMQHYQIDRDIEIAVFDGNRGTGNNLCLPAGPLREPLSRAREVDFIVSSTQSMEDTKIKEDYIMNLQPLEWVRISDGERFLPNSWPLVRAVHAVAGIGNPSKFFSLLRELGLEPIEHSFPDHYQFTKSDLLFEDNLPIVMTEKDSVRCSDIDMLNLWFLRVESDLPNEFAEKILLLLKQKKEKNE